MRGPFSQHALWFTPVLSRQHSFGPGQPDKHSVMMSLVVITVATGHGGLDIRGVPDQETPGGGSDAASVISGVMMSFRTGKTDFKTQKKKLGQRVVRQEVPSPPAAVMDP